MDLSDVFETETWNAVPVPRDIRHFVAQLLGRDDDEEEKENLLRLDDVESCRACGAVVRLLQLLREAKTDEAIATALRTFDEAIVERVLHARSADVLLTGDVAPEAMAIQGYRIVERIEPCLCKRLQRHDELDDAIGDIIVHHLRIEKRIASFFRDRMFDQDLVVSRTSEVCGEVERLYGRLAAHGLSGHHLTSIFGRTLAWMRIAVSKRLPATVASDEVRLLDERLGPLLLVHRDAATNDVY